MVELDRLLAAFRENPRSVVFVPLAHGYLKTGRAVDAIDVLAQGLVSYPDHPEGLLTLGQAYMMLHRWKEAEIELVKVIKLDRYNQRAFSLLGEILARRGNYDVAVKALQRAIDLDPLDDRSSRMLARARVRRALDPPEPIPGETQPLMSRSDGGAPLPAAALALGSSMPPTGMHEFDDVPTTVGAPPEEASHDTFDSLDEGPTTVELIQALPPAEAIPAYVNQPKAARPELRPVTPEPQRMPAATPPHPMPVGKQQARRRRTTEKPLARTTRPPLGQPVEAPPAPIGPEEYLNQVLDARAASWGRDLTVDDGLPVEPWGQRVRRPFLWLWLALGLATVSGAGWYLGDIWARDRAVARHLEAAHGGLITMSATSLGGAEDQATLAIARNPASVESVAMLANARAFALLVYGDGQASDVETTIVAARMRLKDDAGKPAGRRELLLARAAFALAVQNRGADVAHELGDVKAELDGALVQWPQEPLIYWLNGLARLASGDRGGAREALRQAQSLGLVMARVTLADMDLDDGAAAAAVTGYEEVLKSAPQQSLALAGRALARAETASDADAAGALKELEPTLAHVDGKRAEAWARLAVARLCARAGDPERARTELDAAVATGATEARFLARAALALLDDGRIENAYTTRMRIHSRAADPLLPVVDAELLLAGGRPEEALTTVGAADDGRAKLARGRALLDGGRAGDAVPQLEAALQSPATAGAARTWLALARNDVAALGKLAETGSPLARGLLGEAKLRAGDGAAAQRALEDAVEANPLAYRVTGDLAMLHLAANRPADAEGQARASLAYAPGYLPAHAALGRALVALGRQSEAGPELKLVVEANRASALDELAYAEASLAQGDPDAARAALARAGQKGAPSDAVARISALLDPNGAPPAKAGAAPAAAKPAKAPAKARGKKRRR